MKGKGRILPSGRMLTEKEKHQRYLAKHPEAKFAALARTRKWARKNKYRIAASDRARRLKDPERHKMYYRRWRLKNLEKSRERGARYRARKRAAKIGDSADIVKFMKAALAAPFQLCRWCTLPVSGRKLCFDHVIPLSRGGKHCVSNLVVSCIRCNTSKRNRLLREWKIRPFVPPGCDGLPCPGSPNAYARWKAYWGYEDDKYEQMQMEAILK